MIFCSLSGTKYLLRAIEEKFQHWSTGALRRYSTLRRPQCSQRRAGTLSRSHSDPLADVSIGQSSQRVCRHDNVQPEKLNTDQEAPHDDINPRPHVPRTHIAKRACIALSSACCEMRALQASGVLMHVLRFVRAVSVETLLNPSCGDVPLLDPCMPGEPS